jgi:hypothetical protein
LAHSRWVFRKCRIYSKLNIAYISTSGLYGGKEITCKAAPQPQQKILPTHGPIITASFFYWAITSKVMIADFTFTR